MYIRWERKISGEAGREVRALECLLIRTGNGESPEQPGLCLARIDERCLHASRGLREFHRGIFWKELDRRLGEQELPPAVRTRLEETIALTVPRPPAGWEMWPKSCSLF